MVVSVGMLEVNCYLVPAVGGGLYVIDPGAEPEKILAAVRGTGQAVKAVLLTHGHVDHIGAAREVSEAFGGVPVYLHPDDHRLYFSPENCLRPFVPPVENPVPPQPGYAAADFEIIHTPGHTRGCVCFHFRQHGELFCGDTLFRESVGRTDLPGGDPDDLASSIKEKLYCLPPETKAYPGHGPMTTIAHEAAHNMYVRGARP